MRPIRIILPNSLIIFLLLLPKVGVATEQCPDRLVRRGDSLPLLANPLESYPKIDSLRPLLFGDGKVYWSTGCYRGYIAVWTIIDGQLYLTHLYDLDCKRSADLAKLFGNDCRQGRVKAGWITDELFCGKGRKLYSFNTGYQEIYERELGLVFDKGQFVRENEYKGYVHLSRYHDHPEKARDEILSKINWKKVPPEDDGKRVYLTISPSGKPRPGKIVIIRSSGDPRLDKMAVGAARHLGDWDVMIRRDLPVGPTYGMIIRFDEENRLKYGKARRKGH